MGYRQRPLSARLGLSFDAQAPHWRLSMPEAECYMYLVAHLHQCFGSGYQCYIEGPGLDPEVLALYQSHASQSPGLLQPVLKEKSVQRLHVDLGPALARSMNRLAACKTFVQMGEVLMVYQDQTVWMDGSRLDERLVRLHGSLKESQIKRFASGPLRGRWERWPA